MNKKFNKAIKRLGVSLQETLVVIVILAIIAAISVPTTAGLIERTKQKADVANAISIKTSLQYMISEGDIEFREPDKSSSNYTGVYVVVWSGDKCPGGYSKVKDTNIFYGVDAGTYVNDEKGPTDWMNTNSPAKKKLQEALEPCFGDGKIYCQSKKAWDWYMVQITHFFDTDETKIRINSGMKGEGSEAFGKNAAKDGKIVKYL